VGNRYKLPTTNIPTSSQALRQVLLLKKNAMKNLIILSTILASTILLTGCNKDIPEDQQIDYDEDVKPLIVENTGHKVRGSCNTIDDQSTCIDFIGSVFTEERMKLSCEGVGAFSENACPYSELGGCASTPDTISESIIWSYDYGGQPISKEEAGYQAAACNALPMGKWVMPEDLLEDN